MSPTSHDETSHQFFTDVDGQRAVLDYTLSGSVMNITHTGVPQAIGGRGVAADLMRAALRTARDKGWTVNPICSYAVTYLKKHPQEGAKQHMDDLLDEALDESYPASDSPAVGGVD